MLTVVCIKVGKKYGANYVNTLQSMVDRHLTVPHDFVCITDDHVGVNCKCILPELEGDGWWTKLTLFRDKPYGIEGKILYLDLDIVIRENIDCFAQYFSDFVIIQDWMLDMYNSSVFLLETGTRNYVWDSYAKDPQAARRFAVGGDQHWITDKARGEIWPDEWIKSYKMNKFKDEGKIVVFHGRPKPHECDGWVKYEWV